MARPPAEETGSGGSQFRYAAALRYGPAVTPRRDLRSGQPVQGRVTTVRSLGGCCGSGGAEVSGELVAEFLVLGPQPGDLVAVGPYLLAERVGGGPLGGGQGSRAAGSGVAEPGDLVAELGLAVQ